MSAVDISSEQSEANIKKASREYVNHLINDGIKEEAIEGEVHLPPWFNEELFKRAQYYYEVYLFALFGSMSAGLIAVLSIPSILQVLTGTKQSGNASMAYKRYIATIFHVKSWYEEPLKPGSKSWRSIEMVRMAHFRASKLGDKKNFGKITQKDLAITQFGFCGFITMQGKIPQEDFYESNIHFWRVIGYMMGIKDEYNLCTDSWRTTKSRMEIVQNEIYKPALENSNDHFKNMTKYLIDGLWCLNSMITHESSLYITKWLAGCKGYEYLEDDFKKRNEIPPKDGLSDEYKKLKWWDRFVLNYFMIASLYLYAYSWIRIYLNFRVKLSLILIYYFPFLAMIKFGIKKSYVRIFDKKSLESTKVN